MAETSYQMLEVCTFIILQTEEGVISFNKNNLANFSGEKKSTIKLSRVSIFISIPKT